MFGRPTYMNKYVLSFFFQTRRHQSMMELPVKAQKDHVLLQKNVLLSMLNCEVIYMPTSIEYEQKSSLQRGTRFTLVEWMAAVCGETRCEVEVLPVSVNIMVQFLSLLAAREQLDISQLQLTAATCIFIAAKLRDYFTFSAAKIVDYTDNTYTTAQLITHEKNNLAMRLKLLV